MKVIAETFWRKLMIFSENELKKLKRKDEKLDQV